MTQRFNEKKGKIERRKVCNNYVLHLSFIRGRVISAAAASLAFFSTTFLACFLKVCTILSILDPSNSKLATAVENSKTASLDLYLTSFLNEGHVLFSAASSRDSTGPVSSSVSCF